MSRYVSAAANGVLVAVVVFVVYSLMEFSVTLITVAVTAGIFHASGRLAR